MKFKSFMIAALAATVGLAACSKEGTDQSGAGETKNVSFVLSKEGKAKLNRAPGTHVNNAVVTINDAYIFFTDANGVVMHRVKLEAGTGGYVAPSDGTDPTVGIDTAEDGVEITSVPGSTTAVYIIGNLPVAYPAKGANLNTVLNTVATTITVNSQYDVTGKGVGKVTLYGTSGLTTVDATQNKYSAEVEISPIAARMEVGRITGIKTAGKGIESFKVQGIYINGYYTSMTLDGKVPSANVNHGTDKSKYNGAIAGSEYISYNEILSDYTASVFVGQGAGPAFNIYAPKASADADKDVWGYNLLAPTAAGSKTPSIILKVSDVAYTEDDGATTDVVTYKDKNYLTIQNFYVDGSATPLASLQQGYVYRIKDLKFKESDLTANPEMNMIDIELEATFLTWTSKDVDYDFD